MVKLFAWEKAVSDDIKEKRDKELHSVWNNKVFASHLLSMYFLSDLCCS